MAQVSLAVYTIPREKSLHTYRALAARPLVPSRRRRPLVISGPSGLAQQHWGKFQSLQQLIQSTALHRQTGFLAEGLNHEPPATLGLAR